MFYLNYEGCKFLKNVLITVDNEKFYLNYEGCK